MKGDIKTDNDDGVEKTQKKVKSGVEYLKPGSAAPVERPVRSGDPPEQLPQISHQRRPTSKQVALDAQSAEPNQRSKWVPKYCPYCGGPLTGLFSCGDVEAPQSSEVDEGNDNVEEGVGDINIPTPQDIPPLKPVQRNVQTPKADVKVDAGEVQGGGDEKDENDQQRPEASARSDQPKPRDLSLQQREIEAKGKKQVAKIDEKEKRIVAKNEAKKVNIEKKVEENILKNQPEA